MIQELANKIWDNAAFHTAAKKLELSWLCKDLNASSDTTFSSDEISKLVRASSILACSDDQVHRRQAFRTATCAYELAGNRELPLDQALRVVLARLGNFPSLGTRQDVEAALDKLPLVIASEEIAARESREVTVSNKTLFLTNFQFTLWNSLIGRKRVAIAAPTSAGKSFVLQHFLFTLFNQGENNSVIYIVPTRALITQVASDIAAQFRDAEMKVPEIITVPVDSDTKLPDSAIYVMTQERAQLTIGAHPDFQATVLVIDEAHAIAEGARGVLLQWVIDDLLRRNTTMQVMFASPGIRNLDVFGKLFGLSDVIAFSSIEPTVAQNFLCVTINVASKGNITVSTFGDGTAAAHDVAKFQVNHPLLSRVEKLVHVSFALGAGQSSIVYANGAAEAEKVAIQLSELSEDREPNQYLLDLSELAKEAVHPQYVLAECVKHGVGFHYSNIPTQLRHAVEKAVVSGQINFLVCTSTLLQGVNLPVKNIFMFAPTKGKTHLLDSTDFWNLSGRAGRLRREFQGNIFLIDYEHWEKKPLSGPKDAQITPAIEETVRQHGAELVAIISDGSSASRQDKPDLETTFARLYSDMKRGDLGATLQRIGLESTSSEAVDLGNALQIAAGKVSIPSEILNRSPNISAHKQQRLFDYLHGVVSQGKDAAKAVIPLHPRDSSAWNSYVEILRVCHDLILGLDTSRGLHKFHVTIALKWMLGLPLPQIIDGQITRAKPKSPQTVIRETLDLIEKEIRFQAVRLFGCYNALLIHALDVSGMMDLATGVPSLPLYLEIGASDKTMISFVSLGLSRVTAMKLNELSARKDLDVPAALRWLKTRPYQSLGLSQLLIDEINAVIAN